MNTRLVSGLLPRMLLGAASVLALLSVSATAFAHPVLADASRELAVFPSPYARYLVARYAQAQGDAATAADALADAVEADPQTPALREQAFLAAMKHGNIDHAQALTIGFTPQSDTSEQMVHALLAVSAVKAGRYSAARKEIDAALKVDPGDRTASLLKPYVLALSGQWSKAVDDSGDAAYSNESSPLMGYFLKSERARIEELRGHADKASALYEAVYKPGVASFLFGPDYAAFLERQGRVDEARTVWQTLADGGDASARRALTQLRAPGYVKPALPDLKQSVAQALFLSSTLYYSNRAVDVAMANLRLAVHLDPSSDRQRIFLGQMQQDMGAPEAAEETWAAVAPSSPFYAEAALRRIWSLRSRDQATDAMTLVDQALADDPDNVSYVIEKASLLQAEKDSAGALAVIDGRIQRAGDKDLTWQAWYLQAMANDGVGQWDKAEIAIKKAQALEPNRPEVLNFLGYGWISRGINVKDGMDLIRQAMAANPKSGAIVDSLGWGYYQQGDYASALEYLERAVQMSPSDAEINEHLGDVYKALGRDVEAGYEWQRVLTLDVEAAEAERIRKKIDANDDVLRTKGLLPETAAATGTTADNLMPVRKKKRSGFGRA